MKRRGFFFQRRWFIGVYITVAVFILLLITFVFFWFHARSMEDMKLSQTEVVKNTQTVFRSQLDSYDLAAYQLYAMPASTVLLAKPENTVSFTVDLTKQAQSAMASNDLIDLVALFDPDGMVMTRQKRVISQESMTQLHEKAVTTSSSLFFLEAKRMAYGTPVRMLCTVVGDHSKENWENGMILCINADELANRLLSQMESTYILDLDGNVMLSNQTELFGEQLPGYAQILSAFESSKDLSAVICKVGGVESMVCKVSDEDNNFQVVSINPVSQLQQSLNRGMWQLYLATFLILAVAGVITMLLSKFLSRPADELLKEIADMSPVSPSRDAIDPVLAHSMLQKTTHTIDQLQVIHRKDQQTQYLLGLTRDLQPETLFPTDGGWFLAVLQADLPPTPEQNGTFVLIIDSITEILKTDPKYKESVILTVQDGTAALVCPNMQGQAEKIIPYLRQELDSVNTCPVSISTSDKEEAGTLLDRYQNALMRMRAKSLRKNGALITRISEEEAPRIKLSSDLVEEIHTAVRAGKKEDFPRLSQELLDGLETCHFEYAFHQLVDLCISLFQNGDARIPKNTLFWGEAYQKLLECINRDQLKKQLVLFWEKASCKPVVSHKEEQIQAALLYINQHYADEGFSMSVVADHLHMSASHFSRLFKEIMDESFPGYVNRLRLSYAYQRLLDDPESTIEKIAQESGFYSSSYFTTLFRKHYGFSPSQARRQMNDPSFFKE